MKSLFRSIRRKLLGEGKLLRYLTYAIGEIVLIIAGILIALKINDWNGELEDRRTETKILAEIQENLRHDLDLIQRIMTITEQYAEGCDTIRRLLQERPEDSAEIISNVWKLRSSPHFDPNKSGYSLLLTNGVGIILNDSLRGAITALYESSYSYYNRKENEHDRFMHDYVDPLYLKYFTWDGVAAFKGERRLPRRDYERLLSDDYFSKLVGNVKREHLGLHDLAGRTERQIRELIEELEVELEGSNK